MAETTSPGPSTPLARVQGQLREIEDRLQQLRNRLDSTKPTQNDATVAGHASARPGRARSDVTP